MAKFLNEEKKQQVLALDGWLVATAHPSRRPESVAKRRRVSESGGIAVRPPVAGDDANQNRPTKLITDRCGKTGHP